MSAEPCPRCGASLRTKQINNLLSKYCDYCGSLPNAVNVKTGKAVYVDRAGQPSVPYKHRPAPSPATPAPAQQEKATAA